MIDLSPFTRVEVMDASSFREDCVDLLFVGAEGSVWVPCPKVVPEDERIALALPLARRTLEKAKTW